MTRRADSFEKALPDHVRIAQALLRRDVEGARTALYSHLKNAYTRTVAAAPHGEAQGRAPGGRRDAHAM